MPSALEVVVALATSTLVRPDVIPVKQIEHFLRQFVLNMNFAGEFYLSE